MTRRESILSTIKAGLATITTGNGYLNTILSSQIKHWSLSSEKSTAAQLFFLEDQDEHAVTDAYKEIIRLKITIIVTASNPYTKLCSLVLDFEKYFYNTKSTYKTKYGFWHINPVASDTGMQIEERKRGIQEIAFEIEHRSLFNGWLGPDTTNWT